jgi:Ca2+-binding EF-hand superfamily protein
VSQNEALQRELRNVLEDIARLLPLKFKHPRDAFRPLDVNRVGRIDKEEMRGFLRGFGHTEETADRIFELLADGSSKEGETPTVNFRDFMSHFDPVLGPQFRRARRAPLIAVQDQSLEREVNVIGAILKERLTTKYKDIREAFRALDLNHDGSISYTEMRTFMGQFNLPVESADKFWAVFDEDGSGEIQFDEFMALFGDLGDHSDTARKEEANDMRNADKQPRRIQYRRLA